MLRIISIFTAFEGWYLEKKILKIIFIEIYFKEDLLVFHFIMFIYYNKQKDISFC